MPEPDDNRTRALNSLDDQIRAFEAQRAPKAPSIDGSKGISDGYRLLAGLIGGVLGGLGLGWTFDYFAHTSPIGLISGLLIGTVVSIVAVVVQASQMSAKAAADAGPVPPAPVEDDDDDA
jgi:ATP synthase protein I